MKTWTDAYQLLKSQRTVLASVESCTGGMIADRISDISGVSSHFWGSWVVYDNTAKIDLGVPAELIEKHGAVSREAALSLAECGLRKMAEALARARPALISLDPSADAMAAVSTTGIAGPTGGSPETPVGLCYIGIAIARKGETPRVESREVRAPEGLTRIQYKEHFAREAVQFLASLLK